MAGMSVFLVGLVSWLAAFGSFVAANGAIQEIFAAVLFLVGLLSFTGATICSKIDSARDEATSERGQMQEELKAMRAALERVAPPPDKTPAEAGEEADQRIANWVRS